MDQVSSSLPHLSNDQVENIFKFIKTEKVRWILIRNLSILILMWVMG